MLRIPQSETRAFNAALSNAGLEFRTVSGSSFAPLSPDILMELAIGFGAPISIELVKKFFSVVPKHHVVVEFNSHYLLAKEFYVDRWPFTCVRSTHNDDYSYFEFKKGTQKFYWSYEKGTITTGDLDASD